jgi:hypothetical protein
MKTHWKILIGMVLSPLVFVLTGVVWPPDVFTGRVHILARSSLPDGSDIWVTQHWNNVDFYSTLLYVRPLHGGEHVYLIDGDDMKRWRCKLEPTGANNGVRVMFGSKQRGLLNLDSAKFTTENGVVQDPH